MIYQGRGPDPDPYQSEELCPDPYVIYVIRNNSPLLQQSWLNPDIPTYSMLGAEDQNLVFSFQDIKTDIDGAKRQKEKEGERRKKLS